MNEEVPEMFDSVMKLITKVGYRLDQTDYNQGIGYCEQIEETFKEASKELEIDWNEVVTDAERMKQKNRGDILPALNSLSRFTGIDDPRLNNVDEKRNYIVSTQCWVLTARQYLKMYKG